MLFTLFYALAGFTFLSRASPLTKRASASAYCTNQGLSYMLSSIDPPVQGSGSAGSESTWSLSIDDTSSGYKQTVTGFGAAITDATVAVFNTLSSSALSSLLQELSHFSLLRHTIASSDLSADPAYTYDDNNGEADPSLTNFDLGDRGTAMASLLAQMRSINSNIMILGSSWSPPGWMKLNDALTGTTDNNNLNDGYLTNNGAQYSSQFAQYFVKYLNAFEALGVTVNAITIQNEPLNSQAGYPTMYMASYEEADLIQNYVGPALADIGTEIWAYDHNTDQPSFPQTVVDNAGQYVDTAAWHCYADPLDWTVLTNFHNDNPNVQQYMTECYTSATTGWNWASNFTMGPLQNWASGSIAWTLSSDASDGPHLSTGGCDVCQGLVTVSNGAVTFNIDYYMMAQYSKFIPRGATVLSGSGSYSYSDGTGIQSVATLNPDGSRTVVIENNFPNDVYVTLSTQSGEEWSGSIPQTSVVTWVLPN